MKTDAETVTVKLAGADKALYASGRQIGIQETMLAVKTQIHDLLDGQSTEEDLKPWRDLLSYLEVQASEARLKAMDEMGRAISLGAGKPRERTLRDRVQGAIMGAASGWKG